MSFLSCNNNFILLNLGVRTGYGIRNNIKKMYSSRSFIVVIKQTDINIQTHNEQTKSEIVKI